MDGNTSVIMCERESSDGAGAYPITPSTQMGEYWAEEAAAGHINVSGRPLIFIEPEGEHAAAAVTAGLSMTGLRATNFSSGQGIAYMHESLYAAVGKRLTYVLNMGCRAMTKATLNVHAGHDDYHCVDDTGFFQVFGKNVQEVSDLNIIAHKIAEMSLNPGIVAQDGFLTTHLIESLMLPERALIDEYLGHPDDIIDCPTPAQRLIFGDRRRRIPELWTVDNPVMAGVVQNQDSYMQSVAAQRPFFFDHIVEMTENAMEEFYQLTGRRYQRVATYKADDAEYLIVGQGSVVPSAEVVADYLRETRGLKVGVVNLTMFRPFPGDLLGQLLRGRKGVVVLERTDQPLAEDLPVMREVRATMAKCLENGVSGNGSMPYPGYAAYSKPGDLSPLYSGSFGLGSRDLQPEGLIGAVENMLPKGKHKKLFYLSIDFVHEKTFSPKQEFYQEQILEGYPAVRDLAIHGTENPNLMPKGAITVRFHSVGGWGAITTGKNLAMTLFDVLGYYIKANPKYGSEKKGQPTTYYLSAAPEPIRINSEYFYVDVVLSPDPNVFGHSNPLAGLIKGGVFIIQSELEAPEDVWRTIPQRFQKIIVDNEIRVFYLDAFKIAREEATDVELQFRMQGNAFQGAFFRASNVMASANLTEETLFKAIETQLQHKFGSKGARVVEDNLRVVRRGYEQLREITAKAVLTDETGGVRKAAIMPIMLKQEPASAAPNTDIHRFWEQTGNFYQSGQGGDNLADPFIGLSCIPAVTGIFRDMTAIRFDHPEWNAENCTGCGSCWTVCPDSALPGLVNKVSEVFETVAARVEDAGHAMQRIRKFLPDLEARLRELIAAGTEKDSVLGHVSSALEAIMANSGLDEAGLGELQAEVDLFYNEIKDFKFALTRPFYTLKDQDDSGTGGLLSITVDPYTCKGCMECVAVCNDNALKPVRQTPESIAQLRKGWEFWLKLPNTAPEYIRIEDLEEGVGALQTLLLDKTNYKSMAGGDGACLGCGEKTVMHIFTATVEALMQPRVKKHIAKLEDLITRLERHIRLRMAETIDVTDTEAIGNALTALKNKELTLSNLSSALTQTKIANSIDAEWLRRVTKLLAKLRQLKWCYTHGVSGKGRSNMGMVNSTGCTSVWGSTYPYNPYPFPWANHLFQDSTSMAMGLFEGHMAKMADGFRAIRMAELEIDGLFKPETHDEFFKYFDWRQFTDEEFLLSPPVVAVGGDGSLYDIGFQNLSRMMMSGKPIKVMCVDTQVYSNTGGQACTSGFIGQISDMAQFGKAQKGKEEIRKEIALIGMAHRTTYTLQATMANSSHLIEGFIEGLMARRPALFNIYTPCMPEHGIGDDLGNQQSKLAVESRAYPIFKYHPDHGKTPAECFNLEGNPSLEDAWVRYTLNYIDDDGQPAAMELPLTFADFAATEARFRKQFKKAPRETWNENMVPMAEFLGLSADDRKGKYPYVWAVGANKKLMRLIASNAVVQSCEERQDFWIMLRSIAGLGATIDAKEIAQKAKIELAQKISSALLQLAGGDSSSMVAMPAAPVAAPAPVQVAPVAPAPVAAAPAPAKAPAKPAAPAAPAKPAAPAAVPAAAAPAPAAGGNGFVAAWVDSKDCNACGECIQVNPKMFQFNAKKQAFVANPTAGPFKDIVKAAEKCASRVIHTGTPADPSEKGLEKLLKRAEKFK
ncbi:MAG: 2-oxoacid:acceptor oxidoreductase family protein [Candidatus Hydrogenedentes bacterium]|nr:2-oxoacid:acceptor oxidoreductase family protein [Candidatus Hydrogenedentota bacterium]